MGGLNSSAADEMSHFCCLSASVGATAARTRSTVDAGSESTPRWPTNGSCSLVTGGMSPWAFVTPVPALAIASYVRRREGAATSAEILAQV